MADRTFVRDLLGRFATSAGRAAAGEVRKAAAEKKKDLERVAKAKLDEKISDVQGEIAEFNRDLRNIERPGRGADVHESVEFEELRAARRDDIRKAKLKLAAFRAARKAVGKIQ